MFLIVKPGFPSNSVKNPRANAGDMGLIPGSGRSPRERNNNPFQNSCLGYPMDSGVWWATSMESQKSQIQLHTKQRQQLLTYQIVYEFISE